MYFSRPIQWYHSHADQIWPDGTFKKFVYFNEFPAYFKNPNSTDWVAVSKKCQPASKRNIFFKDAM
jgi:hypothetical protein